MKLPDYPDDRYYQDEGPTLDELRLRPRPAIMGMTPSDFARWLDEINVTKKQVVPVIEDDYNI